MKREKYEAIAVSVDTCKSTRLVISVHLINNVSDKSVVSLLFLFFDFINDSKDESKHAHLHYI